MSMSITTWRSTPDASGPVSCDVCGCRLLASDDGAGWRHYPSPEEGRDARGCRPSCVGLVHDRDGRATRDMVPA